MAIKYSIRLNSGTENCLLNEAYKMSQAENHHWLHSIHHLLNIHGFSDIWNNPSIPVYTFLKAFKLRADDQFNQSLIGKLQPSSRFTTLKEIPDNRGMILISILYGAPEYETFSLGYELIWISYQHLVAVRIYSLPVHSVPENPKQSNTSY